MAKYQKITDYQAKYLDVSKGIIDVLEKNDRQMEYLQYDIKAERCRIDSTSGTVTYLPSREDSYERLLEGNKQFPSDDEDVDDAAIKAVMIEKMLTCLKRLSPEKQKLITALFFDDMLVDPMKMEGGYNLFSEQFNLKYKDEIAELFAIITNEDGDCSAYGKSDYDKRVQMFTDFRTYLTFDLESVNRDGESQRLSKTMGKKSGGETQTPFYVAVLASFAQLYRTGRDKTQNTARLIIFDEAFSKMDGERIVRSVQLLRQFNFQVILSAPTEKVGDIGTLVDRNLCVLREGKHTCVKAFDPRKSEWIDNE